MRTKGHRQAHLSKTLTAFSSAEYGSRPPGVQEYQEKKSFLVKHHLTYLTVKKICEFM